MAYPTPPSLDGKTVLLAGSTGMAGFHVLTRLLDRHPGCRVRAVMHRRPEPRVDSPRVQYVSADLREAEAARRVARGADFAVMCAAETGGAAMSADEPWRQVNDNLAMLSRFIEACALEKVRRLVLVVSATVYQPFTGSIREDELDLSEDPADPYFGVGWVNRMAEKLAAFWHRGKGLSVAIARCSNIFGPWASFDPARSNFIPALIRKAADRLDPFVVWGRPEVTRDVLFAADFAEAVDAMLVREDLPFEAFNLGTGRRTTVGEVVRWTLEAAGYPQANVVWEEGRAPTLGFRALDCEKAKRVLQWSAGTPVPEGIRRTMAWWQANRAGYTR